MAPRPGSHHNPFLSLWQRAAEAEHGVYLRLRPGADVNRVKSLLYSARNRSGMDSLRTIAIRSRPTNPTGELWLIRVEEGMPQPHA